MQALAGQAQVVGVVGEAGVGKTAIAEGKSNDQLAATLDDAAAVADLLDAERKSMELGHPIKYERVKAE